MKPFDWSLLFEIMCDASDYAMGAVLGQRVNKLPHFIYYASKTMMDAQVNYRERVVSCGLCLGQIPLISPGIQGNHLF
jgi:hypothetical protein